MTRYEDTLFDLAQTDSSILVMTAENRAAIRSLEARMGARFIDTGITEQTLVGMAAGLALRGNKPVVHALAAFLTMRAYEFIRTDVGIANLPVKLVGFVPGVLSDGNGPTHQAIEDIAIMRGIPGMKVFCPADEDELVACLPAIMADPSPYYIRYNGAPAVVPHPLPGRPDQAEIIAGNVGDDVLLLSHGILLGVAYQARYVLLARGLSVCVMNVRSPWPLDEATVMPAVAAARVTVTVEDHFRTGGLYSILAETLLAQKQTANVLPLDFGRTWFRPGTLPDVLAHHGFTADKIAARVCEHLGTPAHVNNVAFNAADPTIVQSEALWQRSKTLIPAGTQTLAKGPTQYVDGVAPKYLVRGHGAHVWDPDGNRYLDMMMAVGPLSLGYANPVVDAAISRQLEDGITFSLMHPLEVEVAELLRAEIPGAESVRFSKTGCDVTTAAVRVARAFTGRERVVCCGYHGWHDWYISVTDRTAGIPKSTQDLVCTFDYNNIESLLLAVTDQTACVILEPMILEHPKPGFLEMVRKVCSDKGALLIFDEMWTGFRMNVGGAQKTYGVTADLACFSKAMANGMPISALTGRADVMQKFEKDVFFFTTFGGEALSLAATKATIGELKRHNVPNVIAARGHTLRTGIDALLAKHDAPFVKCVGMDARTMLVFDPSAGNGLEMKSYVQQELIRRGILWTGFHNMSFAHSEADVAYVLSAYNDLLPDFVRHTRAGTLGGALRGAPVQPVFRKTTKFPTKD